MKKEIIRILKSTTYIISILILVGIFFSSLNTIDKTTDFPTFNQKDQVTDIDKKQSKKKTTNTNQDKKPSQSNTQTTKDSDAPPSADQTNTSQKSEVLGVQDKIQNKTNSSKLSKKLSSENITYTKATYIIDGDTFVTQEGKKVRLIGVNTPEMGEPYYTQARNALADMILNKTIRLEKDISDVDRYGRLLRYVYVGDVFVNLELVKQGYAQVATYPPDVKYKEMFLEAQRKAKEDKKGLWGEKATGLIVLEFHPDAKGDDQKNLNDEYFTIKNTSSDQINLQNFTISDAAGNRFTLPYFLLEPQKSVTIYTGSDVNTSDKIYLGSDRAIWNNSGDTLYITSPENEIILKYTY